MGMKYTETDYKKTMQIMINAFKKAEEMKFENQIVSQIGEMLLYTHGFYHNSQTNTKKLEMNTFSQYSLSKQLRMICIFIQDQSRLMKEELYKSRKKSFRTGMEMNIANRPVDHFPQEKISFSDNYEGMLEYFNTIIHFVYYSKKKDLKKNDIGEHGDIHPFGIPEFEQLTYIAQQRRMHELLEEKFRYGEWGVELVHNQNNQNVYLFKPERKDKFKSHITASIRREYQYKSNIIRYANFQKVERAMVAVEKLALQIEIDNIEKFKVDRRLYKEATEVVSSLITVYRDLTKKYYFQCKFDGITVDDLINMYEFLYTYSQIYMESVSKHFNQDDYTTYKYIVPVVSLEYLLNEFVLLYGYERNLAKKLLDNFVYHEHLKKEEGDIFSRPLLKVNKSQVLLCESLIEQINIERNVEQWLKKYDVDLTPVGYQFEDKLRKKLGSINGIEVNNTKFENATYIDTDQTITTPGIYFIKGGVTVNYNSTTNAANLLFIGDDSQNISTVAITGNYIRLRQNTETGHFLCKNIVFKAAEGFTNYLFTVYADESFANVAFDQCQIALNGKPVSAITNDKRSIANFSMENSTIKITAVTQQFIINTSSNKNQDYGNVIFRNNTFYCPSGKVNQLVLFNGSASGIANLTIENNTFINLETNTGGYVNIGNLAKTSIKNNIFWTNTDGTGNVVIIRPQITSPTGDICADNLLYKTMTYNWQMFYGGKLPFEGAEELKALTSNPFDGGTFDLANGIFVPNAEYAEYGATN